MPFVEVINGFHFEFYQVNGTKYYKNCKPCPDDLLAELERCAGEIFLSGIPEHVTADQMATIACSFSEMYILRFKVNFAGLSRGFAYLQYLNPNLMRLALKSLPKLLAANNLGKINVGRSKNTSNLMLRNITDMTREEVRLTLGELCAFEKCNLRCFNGNKMEAELVFGSNEDAVKARRFLLGQVGVFGDSATIGWAYCQK